MNYLKYIRLKIRHNPFPRVILDALAKMGIKTQPYYLCVEGLSDRTLPPYETGFHQYLFSFLGPEDMKKIGTIPHRFFSEQQLLSRLKKGQLCFAAKCRGKIAAFAWCNLEECHYDGCNFPLKNHEAYLFDTYTLNSFRGRGIAPYLRYHLYEELARMGRKRLYSVSERFNIPSIRFKQKLNAKFVGRGIYVELFKRRLFCSSLKRLSHSRLNRS